MNRRDLLKAFGIGTVIAPVLGGAADLGLVAKLIEVPKVELFANTHRCLMASSRAIPIRG